MHTQSPDLKPTDATDDSASDGQDAEYDTSPTTNNILSSDGPRSQSEGIMVEFLVNPTPIIIPTTTSVGPRFKEADDELQNPRSFHVYRTIRHSSLRNSAMTSELAFLSVWHQRRKLRELRKCDIKDLSTYRMRLLILPR